ncbi:hypothetical protein GJ496_003730 [Pomphorhynchus laevis]|nr:hypothetical protein GJ496_003730 [Pomphorhynchus laevis]
MPQNEYVERRIRRYGRRLDHDERVRKKEGRAPHKMALKARRLQGIKAKLYNRQRRTEKIQMKKTIRMHEKKISKENVKKQESDPIPPYLFDRGEQTRSTILSNTIKQKRKEKAGKWNVPISKVGATSDAEVFKVLRTGKRRRKAWKRMVTKPCFVPDSFTRKPPKYERFIRPMALRYKTAHVTHPELKSTFQLEIIGVKRNPNSDTHTRLGVLGKGTIIEVNVSELGLVTKGGKVVWGKYAQITNKPENDGCVNALLIV